jgi:hypothetical protein
VRAISVKRTSTEDRPWVGLQLHSQPAHEPSVIGGRYWPLGDKRHWPRRGAQAPAGFRRLASGPVVFFPLVANRAHDNVVADDLEENDVARAAEWNDQFARATIAQFCSTA